MGMLKRMFYIEVVNVSDKKFVDVTAEHTRDGKVNPLSITWEDGRVYSVDRVLEVRMALINHWPLKLAK